MSVRCRSRYRPAARCRFEGSQAPGQRERAVEEVKASVLLERVAEEENVQVGDDELNRELEALARQSKQTSEAVRARLTRDGGLDRIRTRIRNEKTLEFLYRQSA